MQAPIRLQPMCISPDTSVTSRFLWCLMQCQCSVGSFYLRCLENNRREKVTLCLVQAPLFVSVSVNIWWYLDSESLKGFMDCSIITLILYRSKLRKAEITWLWQDILGGRAALFPPSSLRPRAARSLPLSCWTQEDGQRSSRFPPDSQLILDPHRSKVSCPEVT